MTPLRQRMIEAMRGRGFSHRTHKSYLGAVTDLARYTRRSPDVLRTEDIQRYFNYLAIERGLSGASCRLYLNGIRFLYLQVLAWSTFDIRFQMPKKAQRIPELLTTAEVSGILSACENTKHRTLLTTCYGCGLRLSELASLKVRDIDGERHLLRIAQGKGAKDRLVLLSDGVLLSLRGYWKRYRPAEWLFTGQRPTVPLGVSSIQKVYQAAKRGAGVDKVGGIHALRHASATHQLAAGMSIHVLQRQLGHHAIQTTLHYLHWVPNYQAAGSGGDLIAALETAHE